MPLLGGFVHVTINDKPLVLADETVKCLQVASVNAIGAVHQTLVILSQAYDVLA